MPGSNILLDLVLNELKAIGIKHKEKKTKIIKVSDENRLFRQGLQYLKLADAFLENGTVVQIPKFVVEACSYILEHCDTEGIFRRAGSAAKQREIRKSLEDGNALGKCHRVIDVANIVSYFFRELPEPLIPFYLHETLVRCLLTASTTNNSIHSMQLACLLMPLLTAQTLAYFMQFLNTITRHVSSNKMSAQNLAIVIAPSIMPYRDINSVRFTNHIKIVELLIKNSSVIGTIPMCIKQKLGNATSIVNNCSIQTKKKRQECSHSPHTSQKHRRSHIFGMLKTKVGLTINSENVDFPTSQIDNSNTQDSGLNKKILKESETIVKSKKCSEPFNAFRAKKSEKMQGSLKEKQGTNKRRWSLTAAGRSKIIKNDSIMNNDPIQSFSNMNTYNHNDCTEEKKNRKSCLSTCKNEFDAVMERVSSIKAHNNNSITESDETPANAKLINTRIKKESSSEDNSIRALNKNGTLRRVQENPRINRRNSCTINVSSEFPMNFRLSKSQNFNISNTQLNETISNQWVPFETSFQNFDNCYTPVQQRRIHYESRTQELKNLNKFLYSSTNNIRTLSTEANCRKDVLKLKSSSKSIVEDQGRASIVRLRTENVGMVLARTKLFE